MEQGSLQVIRHPLDVSRFSRCAHSFPNACNGQAPRQPGTAFLASGCARIGPRLWQGMSSRAPQGSVLYRVLAFEGAVPSAPRNAPGGDSAWISHARVRF